MKIYLGADHAGFKLKEKIKKYLDKSGFPYSDLGALEEKKEDDYPDYAFQVAKKVSKFNNAKGLLVCGSGTGMVIAANKIKGARAVLIDSVYVAKKSREDNDANIACFRSRGVSIDENLKLLTLWLKTEFSKKTRHKRRIKKIDLFRNMR